MLRVLFWSCDMARLTYYTTGEVASMLAVPLRKVDYACAKGSAGRVAFCGGRRLLAPENIRALARHLGKPIPAEGLADLNPSNLALGRKGDDR